MLTVHVSDMPLWLFPVTDTRYMYRVNNVLEVMGN